MRLGVVLGLVMGAFVATVAHADPSPGEIQAARDLFSKAETDEDAGNWSAALDKLRRAASVKMTPGIRYHLGLCEEKLGQIAAALNDYSGAESMARQQKNKEVLDIVAEPIRSLKGRVPTLFVEAPTIDRLTIEIDGRPFPTGLWGIATPMDPGPHQLEARAPNKSPFSATVVLKERDANKLAIVMTDAPKTTITEPPPNKTLVTTTTPAVTNPPVNAQPAPAPLDQTQSRSRVPAVLTTVGAVALGGFGLAAYLIADSQAGDAQAFCSTQATPSCTGNQGSIRAWDKIALTSWIAGGALLVTSIVLWALPSYTMTTARLEVRPNGVWLGGSFQ